MKGAAALVVPAVAVAIIVAIRRGRRPSAPAPGPAPGPAAPRGPMAPSPNVKGLVDPKALADFPAWVTQYEGRIPTMYQDVLGLVTTAIGYLIDAKGLTAASEPPARVFALPWLRPDGTRATQDEIRAEWRRVKAMPAAMVAGKYATAGALHLSPAALDEVIARIAASNVQILVQHFPDFPTYPASAQTALMGMAWGMGPGFAPKWPAFSASVRAHDWNAAANNCKIKNANASRNDAHRALFLAAANVA